MMYEERLYFFDAQIDIIEKKICNLQTQAKALRKKRKLFKKIISKEKKNVETQTDIESGKSDVIHGDAQGIGREVPSSR